MVNSVAAKTAIKPVVSRPSTSIVKAPQLIVAPGKAIAPTVKSLPKSATLQAALIINGKLVSLGSLKTSASGSVTIPAFSGSKLGTYVIQLTNSRGSKYFIKVVVKGK